ncbi:hypothetical protein [Cupriavidus pinatubonensis]|uniref:Lipoprotein n=1 Tax=Cupriavidus pinatubonensis TaxID=248026 RepID=A0ABM8XPU6_9BURK|nr:hypothetical protein [Cupriavidus pinatubonensis]CAG9182324.1 hypothetical protein LMG23994_04872 [Cupriavidus pinatubonensis]
MKLDALTRLLCTVMLATCATTAARADTDRPRQTGVGCARAGNSYCQAPQPAADAGSHAMRPGSTDTALPFAAGA